MAAILVEEADLKRLFRILEVADEKTLPFDDYDLGFYNYFILRYCDLAEIKKNSRLWYQAYSSMTKEEQKKSCYQKYVYYKEQSEEIEEKIEQIKNLYNFY